MQGEYILRGDLITGGKSRVSFGFDCSNLSEFVASIVAVHPFAGGSRSTFYSCVVHRVCFVVKLSLHMTTKGETSSVTVETKILQLLNRRILDRKRSPCIV